MVFGDNAEHLGVAEPERLAREFARDVGDDVPVVVGEHVVSADDLVARLCAWVTDEVSTARGGRPALIAITHPSSWGGHRLGRMRAALERAGIDDPMLVPESAAAAAQLEASHPRDSGQLVAVYDLGGTRFDARVLRRRAAGRYQLVGEQVRIDHLGGANFDDALLRHVLAGASTTDGDLEGVVVADVRREVVGAKELLSSAGDATVAFALPTGDASVRVTRSEFESMIDADLERTTEALDLAIESADAQSDRLEAIVLSGGSARIPLVAQRLSERFDVPILADADPTGTIALGAAAIAREQLRSTELAPGTALAISTTAEKLPAPRPAAQEHRAGVLAFLRPLFSKPSRSTSPLLLGAAAVFIAVTIVFSSSTAAGTRWPDFVQQAASDLLNLTRPTGLSSNSEPQPTVVPVSDQAPGDDPNADSDANRDSDANPKSTPARKSSRMPSGTTPTSPSSPGKPVKSAGGGPKAQPTTPPAGTNPADTTPSSTGNPPPAETTPEATTPPPADNPPPAEPPPPADPPPAENPPPADPPPADPPPADPVPLADPPVEQPAPEPTPGPAPEPA